jgi:hypothetical protein
MTDTLEDIRLDVAPVDTPACIWGSCTKQALYRAVFENPCGPHPATVCLAHRAEADKSQSESLANMLVDTDVTSFTWACHVCKVRMGHIVRWERA